MYTAFSLALVGQPLSIPHYFPAYLDYTTAVLSFYHRLMDWLSFLFPKKCVCCQRIGEYLCSDCLNAFYPSIQLYCPVCRRPSADGQTHPQCLNSHQIDGLVSCFQYKGVIKKLIAKYKYKFVSDLNQTVTELFISEIKSAILFDHEWTIIPVPLHPSRLRWRGYNQAELLATSLSREWSMPLNTRLLFRSRLTSSQMTLSATQRKQNLNNAFQIHPHSSIPSSILLVDDVATTCSTLIECAKVLKQAGAGTVWGLTLAQVIP